MLLWDGACHVHEQFSLEKLLKLKAQYPDAPVLAHPECKRPLLLVADFIGSTQALLILLRNRLKISFWWLPKVAFYIK